MKAISRVILISLTVCVFASCGDKQGFGDPVSIPTVQVSCVTNDCVANVNPRIFVIFTTSGCQSPGFGAVRSGSSDAINCTVSGGCVGSISSWIDGSGAAATTLPSGTFSICGIVDFDRSYTGDNPATGDMVGALENVSIGASTSTQRLETWFNQ